MTDSVTRDRLTALQARLGQPTPRPLEGQETIDLDDPQEPPEAATQPTLW